MLNIPINLSLNFLRVRLNVPDAQAFPADILRTEVRIAVNYGTNESPGMKVLSLLQWSTCLTITTT